MAGHNGLPSNRSDRQPRAVQSSTDHADEACTVHTHGLTDLRAEQRTDESVTAEAAYRDWATAPPTDRPLASQRPALAKILFEVLKKHDVSRNRFADMIGVNEKQVRKMLDGRSPIPLASLGVMPLDMALDFMSRVVRGRGGAAIEAASQLHQGIDGLRREVGATDTRELRRIIREGQRQLIDLATTLDEVG